MTPMWDEVMDRLGMVAQAKVRVLSWFYPPGWTPDVDAITRRFSGGSSLVVPRKVYIAIVPIDDEWGEPLAQIIREVRPPAAMAKEELARAVMSAPEWEPLCRP